MRLTFLGASEEVTGSGYLLETGSERILIDLGLFQGTKMAEHKNYRNLAFDPAGLDAVFITHAHLDHVGRLPLLVSGSAGFSAPIYMTPPTIKLAELILKDSAKVIRAEARKSGHEPLFRERDVRSMLELARPLKFQKPISIGRTVVTLLDAGHILGSAFIVVEAGGRTVVFSGDLGAPPSTFHRWTEKIPETDYLVIESTYGALVHEDARERQRKLKRAISSITATSGTLLIPTFSIDRTQELLYEINHLRRKGLISYLPIFLDSPLAAKVTEIYKRYPDYFNTEAQRLMKESGGVFNFPWLTTTVGMKESLAIDKVPPPKIIIAGSGMMHGGRILRHATRYLPDAKNGLLFIGYQAKGSLGRRLFNGDREVIIEGKKVQVKAEVAAIGAFSGHADRSQLLYWISGSTKPPRKIFLVHGEPETQQRFAEFLEGELRSEVIIPKQFSSIEIK